MVMQAKAALDGDGKIADWQYELWSNTHSTRPTSTTGTNVLAAWYLAEPQTMGAPPARRSRQAAATATRSRSTTSPARKWCITSCRRCRSAVSALRTLGAYANVFASESFMDELAAAANADPVAFRLAHMKDPRARAVIEKVAAMADWKPGEKGDGTRGRGIAFSKYKNLACYVACVAEVEVDRASGKVRVPRAWAATDAGPRHQPGRADKPRSRAASCSRQAGRCTRR